MKWPWSKKPETKAQFEDVLQRLIRAQEGVLGGGVTPENCMQSPTVHAIVTAISNRLSVTPIHVFQRRMSSAGEVKEKLPNHPVANLLSKPNSWQTRHDFWADATSVFVRYGRFYAYKGRGSTGPIRELIPLHPGSVSPKMDDNYNVTFHVSQGKGQMREYQPSQIFHARGKARDFLTGDSPINDVRQAVALEILAEKFGASFFNNGALPLLVFSYLEGSSGFKSAEQEREFINAFESAFSGEKANKAMLLPKGIDKPSSIEIAHDKAQFLETRQHQRTVIAAAFGVPPTIVGDLTNAHYNNVEQMDQDFTTNVIMPVAHAFESAMERDLLTDADRAKGVAIRFNLDSVLRADFKSRQEGLRIQREGGIISPNEWREREGMNPISDEDGGSDYIRPANMMVAGEEPEEQEFNEIETDDTA